MALINRPKAKVFFGPDRHFPSADCTVHEERNPIYGRARCSALFSEPPQGAMHDFPLQLGDIVKYCVVDGDIFINLIIRKVLPPEDLTPATGGINTPQSDGSVLPKASKEHLMSIGFEEAASWMLDHNDKIYHKGDDHATWENLISVYPQALYAFCIDHEVKYIGKTMSTLKSRFRGYRAPGNTTSTNQRCNEEIKSAIIHRKKTVRILVLPNKVPLRWGNYAINIAAGLEDVLIDELQPDWNA